MPIIGDSEESICFDSEGSLMFNRKRSAVSRKFGSGDTVAVLLNLDEKSSNSSTISMFKDGARIAEPQALPESLKGKTLFPTVTFKNMTVHVNFGPQPHVPLPFRCLMIQEAAQADSAVTAYAPPKDGRHEVLFPVLLPDEGTFDWLDWFLEKNPQYAELSSRKVLEWAVRSGLFRSKANSLKNSIDKPDMNFGVPHLDDGSVKRVLAAVAPMQRRDLVVMEVQGNLCKEERMERMNDFSLPQFRKVAAVMVGEPSSGFKRRVRELLLKEKQERAEKDFKERKQERARKRMIELRQRQNERARRRTLRIKRRMERERQRRLEAERSADPGPGAEAAEGEGSEEEEEEAAEPEPEEEEAPPPPAELTAEEERQWFRRPGALGDLSTFALNTAISRFCLPEEAEGFDEVRFQWRQAAEARDHLRTWVLDRKLTTRVEDLQPSEWFKEKWHAWQRDLQKWQAKLAAHKDAKKRDARSAIMGPGGDGCGGSRLGGEAEGRSQGRDLGLEREADARDGEDADSQMLREELQCRHGDAFRVEDVCQLEASSKPLFASFEFEDWALLGLRFELHLLAHAFRHDCPDPERGGIPPEHLAFYYSRYYRKLLVPKNYGMETTQDLLELVSDTVVVGLRTRVVESLLAAELESNGIFVKLAEEDRRRRQLRADAGQAAARLSFPTRPATATGAGGQLPAPARPQLPVAAAPLTPGIVPQAGLSQQQLGFPQPLRVPAALLRQQWSVPRGTISLNPVAAMLAQQRAAMFQQAAWRGLC